ncbi:MAG: hypothetical protein U9O94_10200 [Nanoarchaeota archaeon]|nr:hypothetical protein [Nanoarchaeota archaeon]
MAEETRGYTSVRKGLAGAIPNLFKMGWDKYVMDTMRNYRTGSKELIKARSHLIAGLIPILQKRHVQLKKIEGQYQEMEGPIIKEIRDQYNKIGNYTTAQICSSELSIIKAGTGEMEQPIEILGKKIHYPFPKKGKLVYPDGQIQYPRYYGREKSKSLGEKQFDAVKLMIKHAKDVIDKMDLEGETVKDEDGNEITLSVEGVRRNREKQLNSFRTECENYLTDLHAKKAEEDDSNFYGMHGRMKGQLDGFQQTVLNEIEDESWVLVNQKRPENVVYHHSFYQVSQMDGKGNVFADVFNGIGYVGKEELRKAILGGPNSLDAKKRKEKGNKEIRLETGQKYFEMREAENRGKVEDVVYRGADVAPGLDDRGMPYEVAGPGGYLFIDKKWGKHKYPVGSILMDIFEKHDTDKPGNLATVKVRVVPKEFVARMNLLEVIGWAACEWDEVRDDIRDGRYHPNSINVVDYIMAASKAVDKKWKRKRFPNNIHKSDENPDGSSKFTNYKMELYYPEASGKNRVIKNRRRPSDLSPAFDLRALNMKGERIISEKETWRYIGKRRYYTNQYEAYRTALAEQKEVMLSTRGISMFIIEEICRKGKSLKEIQEELRYIATQTGGFDYGPRTFGQLDLCMDPFDIQYEKVNARRPTRRDELGL